MIGWWVGNISLGAGLLLALLVVGVELLAAVRYRGVSVSEVGLRVQFAKPPQPEPQSPRPFAGVSGQKTPE